MPAPFRIVPWDVDFLESLKAGILRATDGRPGNAVVVFMNDRPRRYLSDSFRKDSTLPRPLLLPRMLTVRELVSAFRQAQQPALRREAGRLDQVALLSSCVRELAEPGTDLCQRLAHVDEAAFFPWGIRLADLMEECFTQGLTPEDLAYTEGEVAPFGAALLGSLGRIFAGYRAALDRRGLTTPGLDAFSVAERLREEPLLPDFLRERAILLAGFGMLTGTEDILFRHLWRNGAQIYLHADPALALGGHVHWACTEQKNWISDWNAETELDCPPAGRIPTIHYFAGYDLHSQLEALREDLLELEAFRPADEREMQSARSEENAAPQQDIAVALTHSGALLPVLHQLPRKDCNISLGYPLERSLLFRLLDTVISVRDGLQADGRTHWRALAGLVRHPYLRLLENNGVSLRGTLQHMETRLRAGGRHADPHAVGRAALEDVLAAEPPSSPAVAALPPLLDRLLEVTVDGWNRATTLRGMAEALSALCDALLLYGGPGDDSAETGNSIWNRFPIDAECLFRFMQNVIPALKDNDMADTPLPWPLLRSMLRDLGREEGVPFEADPLTGLQVLGMLETRLLRFSRIFVVDVTDDRLPGAPIRSPLLPDSLRAVLGLPDTRNRELLAAYTFHRLLAGADEVWLYWQEGVETSGLFDGKKQRSRLVEELVWDEEQRLGRRLKPGLPPLRTAMPDVRPPQRERLCIAKTPAMLAQILEAMRKPFSPTRLDAYLLCPLRAFFERLCAIAPAEDVTEEDDPAAVGLLLHTVLKKFYASCLGGEADRSSNPALSEERLRELFRAEFEASGLRDALPPESAAMLAVAGPERLSLYLANQPETTSIRALEEAFSDSVPVRGRSRQLAGTLDRVDWRSDETGDGAVILDYKTGRIKAIDPDIWEDEVFWERISTANVEATAAEPDPDLDMLPLIADRIPTVQLLAYCHLYGQATGEAVLNAAFVELGNEGGEHLLFGKELSAEIREQALAVRIPDLLRFILLHMELCPEFRPREGVHCRWCSWQNACMLSSQTVPERHENHCT